NGGAQEFLPRVEVGLSWDLRCTVCVRARKNRRHEGCARHIAIAKHAEYQRVNRAADAAWLVLIRGAVEDRMSSNRVIAASVLAGAGIWAFAACRNKHEEGGEKLGASQSIKDLMTARGLTEGDVEAALKTYMPSGKKDEYLIFASGGQSGNIDVIGVP